MMVGNCIRRPVKHIWAKPFQPFATALLHARRGAAWRVRAGRGNYCLHQPLRSPIAAVWQCKTCLPACQYGPFRSQKRPVSRRCIGLAAMCCQPGCCVAWAGRCDCFTKTVAGRCRPDGLQGRCCCPAAGLRHGCAGRSLARRARGPLVGAYI